MVYPKKSTELKAQAAEFQKLQDQGHLTQRLLLRKIIKGFKEQESVLASHKLRMQSLEVQLEKSMPKKRRKVKLAQILSLQISGQSSRRKGRLKGKILKRKL